jgi:hypothetical protein
MIAGATVIAELLRRLHGAKGLELASWSAAAPDDIEAIETGAAHPYCGSFVTT